MSRLNTPEKIQSYINSLPVNAERSGETVNEATPELKMSQRVFHIVWLGFASAT